MIQFAKATFGAERHRELPRYIERISTSEFLPDEAIKLSFRVTLGNGFTLVIELFSTSQGQIYFDPITFEIQLQRHQSQTFFFYLLVNLQDLLLVHEESSLAH